VICPRKAAGTIEASGATCAFSRAAVRAAYITSPNLMDGGAFQRGPTETKKCAARPRTHVGSPPQPFTRTTA